MITDNGPDAHGAAPAVFTGGSLLYGSVGRTDLVDPTRTDELTRALHHSARHLAESLPGETAIYPTHGFGSFCSAGPAVGGPSGTITDERARNDAVLETDEDAFVARLVAGLTAYPAYYAHMAPANLTGPDAIDLSPLPTLEPRELAKRIAAGEWVVDLRDRTAYAAQHLTDSAGIALGPQFATLLGWVIPWNTPSPSSATTRSRSPTRSATSYGSVSTAPKGRPPAPSSTSPTANPPATTPTPRSRTSRPGAATAGRTH